MRFSVLVLESALGDLQATLNSLDKQSFGSVEIFCLSALPKTQNGVFYSADLNDIASRITGDFFILLHAGETLESTAFFTIYRELFARGVDILLFDNAKENPYPLFGSDAIVQHFFAAPNLKNPPFWAASAEVAKAALQNFGTSLHNSALPFYLLLLIAYFGHSLDFVEANIRQNERFQNTLRADDFADFALSMRTLAENLHHFIGHFAVSDTFLNAANALPQKITLFYVDNFRHTWHKAWQESWQGFENADTFKIASNAFTIRFVDWRGTRTEKVGKAVLFPLKVLRSIVWRIEKNSAGRILMKPARFLWRIAYGAARRFYRLARFLRNFKNAHTR